MVMDMSDAAHGPCHGCPDGDDGKAVACHNMCLAPILAVAPQIAPTNSVGAQRLFASFEPLFRGRTSAPEPYPPKSSDIV
jgi:hypothetical protein